MKIFFSVGEPSGDLHGANLIRELSRMAPDCEFVGYGGPRMAQAGCQLHADLTELAVMWFLRVLINVHHFLHLVVRADRYFRHQRPDAVILIDYPGFNWWIARRAKAHGIQVFYYGAPQMWAWAGWRVRKMRRLVDHVLCKLPFEATWYVERGCNATYVGHPYFDEMRRQQLDPDFMDALQQQPGPLVTILPGSRTQEVEAHLTAFLGTAELVKSRVPAARFAIAAFNIPQAMRARKELQGRNIRADVFVGRTPELIQSATVCLSCSGSVSLELMFRLKPTVIHYLISPLADRVQGYFRRVRFITLVNLLACKNPYCQRGHAKDPNGERVPFPEYVTHGDRMREMANDLIGWIEDEAKHRATVAQLDGLRHKFGWPGASRRAAEYIVTHSSRAAANVRTHYKPPRAA